MTDLAPVRQPIGRSARPDEITRTATQVRAVGGQPHRIRRRWWTAGHGWRYRTRCGLTLATSDGAMLTTRDVTCRTCRGLT